MVRRAWLAGALGLLIFTRPAHAEDRAADALADVGILTKAGASYHGKLVERVPDDHVTIELASGDIKRFAWAEIADVATSKESDKSKDKGDSSERPTVRIAVDGEPGVLLERRQSAAEGWTATLWPAYAYVEQWEVACVAPCTTTVDAGSMYRVNGGGATTSRNFTLPQGHDSLRLHLVGRSALLHGTGIAATLIGVLVALTGGSSLVAAPQISDSKAEAAFRGIGWTGVGAGVALMAIGIPIWLATYSVARTGDGKSLGATRPLLAF